jgi:SAM-dependent MidA family methyltransferase
MKALVEFGLTELLELFAKNVSAKQYETEMNKIKILIDPSFMGERFKMACFRKGEV